MENPKKINISNSISSNHPEIQLAVIQLYTTFYPKLFILESLLKFKIVQTLTAILGTNWFKNQIQSNDGAKLIKDELELIGKRKKRSFIIDEVTLINESNFGFWVEFFAKKNYRQFKGSPIKIFSDLPGNLKRKNIYQKLVDIKEFRNEIYHHKNLFNSNLENIDGIILSLRKINADIDLIITLLDPSCSEYVKPNEFDQSIKNVEKIYSKK